MPVDDLLLPPLPKTQYWSISRSGLTDDFFLNLNETRTNSLIDTLLYLSRTRSVVLQRQKITSILNQHRSQWPQEILNVANELLEFQTKSDARNEVVGTYPSPRKSAS